MMQKSASLCNLLRSSSISSLYKIGVYQACRAVSSLPQACETSAYSSGSDDEYADLDWDNLGFGIRETDYMYLSKTNDEGVFEHGQLNRFGNLEFHPSSGVLNYGQGIFEGAKAFRREDGRIFLFRPEQNALRMQQGAERMCMPSPSVDQFVDAVKQTAISNKRWIPPPGKGTLYIRPLLIGNGPVLGLGPAPEFTFLVYASPVGNYFKDGLSALNLYVEDEFHRATRGGVGGVKSITNYAPVLKPLARAKSRGFSDVLYLDSVHKKYIEEATACNVFVVKGNLIATPPTSGNILSGITRKTVLDIARDKGYQVEERAVSIDELLAGEEVFCTGTAVGIVPVGSVTYQGKRAEFKTKQDELVSVDLYNTLLGVQTGHIEDKKGWFVEVQ